MFNFENKVAIVTGGTHGIGKCIVGMLEKSGAQVALLVEIAMGNV